MTAVKTYTGSGTPTNATAVMTEKATSKSSQAFGPSDFTGTFQAAGGMGVGGATLEVTLKASSSTYVLSPIVATGKRGGVVVSESFTPTKADGGEVLKGSQAFDFPPGLVSLAVPAQSGTGGGVSVGILDLVAPKDCLFEDVLASDDGNLALGYQEGSDTIPTSDWGRPATLGVQFERLKSATTVTSWTLFFSKFRR